MCFWPRGRSLWEICKKHHIKHCALSRWQYEAETTTDTLWTSVWASMRMWSGKDALWQSQGQKRTLFLLRWWVCWSTYNDRINLFIGKNNYSVRNWSEISFNISFDYGYLTRMNSYLILRYYKRGRYNNTMAYNYSYWNNNKHMPKSL